MIDKDARDGKTRREWLFSIFSKNLSIYMPEYEDHFLCPVCKTLFARKDLKKLSLAHIIPESLGGRQTTLACSRCDNRIGHDFDWHRSKEKEIIEQKNENRGIYSKLNLNNGSDRYEILFEGHLSENGHLDMHIRPPKNVPSDIWIKRMDELTEDKNKINIKVNLFNPERRNISYIYSSYLLMFSRLGYEYILSPNVDPIFQILNGDFQTLKNHFLVIDLPKPLAQVPIPSIYMLIEPAEARSFFISMPSTNNNRMRCVFLPGFGKTGKEGYNNMLDLIGTQSILDARFEGFSLWNTIPDIGDRKFKNYGKFIWDALVRKNDYPEIKEISNQSFKLIWT